MSQTTLSSRAGGDAAESAVLEAVTELQYVPDTDAEHYDALTTTTVVPRDHLPFLGVCQLDPETPVEIKSAMVVYGEDQARGRFYLRFGQHERLADDGGVYLFAVCEPTPDRDVLALKIVPTAVVAELVSSWISPDGRADYAQIAWSRVFAPAEVHG